MPEPVILTGLPGFGLRTGGFGFVISWAANRPVVVEAATDPARPAWTPLSTNTLTAGFTNFVDSEAADYPSRFYRLRIP